VPRSDVSDAHGLRDVEFVLPTGGGLAYGDFVLDARSRQYLLKRVSQLNDPLTRGAAWVTLWEEMLDKRITPAAFIDAAVAALPRESVQQNSQLIVGYMRDAYWRFSAPSERTRLAPSIERLMRDGITRSSTTSAKAVFFNGLRSMALTPDGVAFLERVWARKEKIAGLPMAEPDEATLALELAVRGLPNSAAILEEQRTRFQNPDRKARFEFVMPALAADVGVRAGFFANLADVKNRRREPWVSEGLSYLHHPLRAAESAQHVRPALERLQEVQQTGDIFFPRDWTSAALTGYQSKAVADVVRGFLAERPDYPLRLRRVILQSADDLFRAAEIVPSEHQR